VQDCELSALAGVEQAWIADGWHARFLVYRADGKIMRPGHVQTETHVDSMTTTDSELLLGYYEAVLKGRKSISQGSRTKTSIGL
jgi:hypothetical protein